MFNLDMQALEELILKSFPTIILSRSVWWLARFNFRCVVAHDTPARNPSDLGMQLSSVCKISRSGLDISD